MGEASITMLIGYLMGWFSPSMLFWSILACSCILFWGTKKIIRTLDQSKLEYEKQIEMTTIKNYAYEDINNPEYDLKIKILPSNEYIERKK